MKALCNARIFDGERLLDGCSVLLDGARIAAVVDPDGAIPEGVERVDLPGKLLAPGFIDVQVNGGADVLFNDQPTVAGIRAIGDTHRRFGTTGFLPTLISDTRDIMAAALEAVAEARESALPGVLGLHLEGPYLNRHRAGIHPSAMLRRPEPDALDLLTRLGPRGRTLVTLAPERVPEGFIRQLTERGVIVSAGHSDACHVDLERAIGEGLRGFTHLFNAMSPMGSREPAMVGSALADPDTWCSIIVDGHHVHPASLRVALAAKPRGRMLLVTDAVQAAASDRARFDLLGQTVIHRDGRVISEHGTLAGSDLTMDRAVRNAVAMLGLPLEESLRMASLYPAAFLGLDSERGRIRPGYRADLVLLNDDLEVIGTWVGGDAAPFST